MESLELTHRKTRKMQSDPSLGTAPSSRPAKASASTAPSAQYLTFQLGEEEYGIDILKVQEIRSYERPTRMAQAPEFIKGVTDLRGVIVPIVDLRLMLRCPKANYTDFTVVIILNVRGMVIGVVVDAVADVVALTRDMIKPAPQLQTQLDATFVTGIASVDQRMLVMMDIEALLESAELGLVVKGVQKS